jgi:hypothetical protein
MEYNDYVFCKNYADGVIGEANKNMDHDRFDKLKSTYEKLTPKEKKEIIKVIKNGNKR